MLGFAACLLLLIFMVASQAQVLRMGFGVALAPHAVLASLAAVSEGGALSFGEAIRGAFILWSAPILVITGVGVLMLMWVQRHG